MSAIDWPDGFERTDPDERESYPHGFRVPRHVAFENILDELRMMDARNVQVETAAPHTKDEPHRPYSDRNPDYPGVVVYFERDGQQFAVPCDRWDNLRDNAQAIARYLDAKRAIQRYGVSTVGSEYQTQALPSGDSDEAIAVGPSDDGLDEEPHEVLGVAEDAPEPVVKGAFRELIKEGHADGSASEDVDVDEVRKARDALLDRGESA